MRTAVEHRAHHVRMCVGGREGNRVDGEISVLILGSVSSNGELYDELSGRLAKAARMFGSLHQSIFVNNSLSVKTHQCVYLCTLVVW